MKGITRFASIAAANLTAKNRYFSVSSSLANNQSWVSAPGNPLMKLPSVPPPSDWALPSQSPPGQNPSYQESDFSVLCNLLRDPDVRPGPSMEAALDQCGVEPEVSVILPLFDRFDSSPKLLHTVFLWAEKNPGFQSSVALFNAMVNALGKARDFESAWSMVLDKLDGSGDPSMVTGETFAVLIRRYTRAGMLQAAIRTFEYASSLDLINKSVAETSLFEILLDSLCKEGRVRVAAEYFDGKKLSDKGWVPSVRVYNILLNGWFRARKLKHGERLWSEMKEKNVRPSVVTYGTLVEGYCRMQYIEKANDLLVEMRKGGIEPNAIVYNPIIDALGEAGRFKEALGTLEHLLQCESGPTISTYNSLVKGFCKAGNLAGASKVLKMMISRGFFPTPTTYNYFFRHFSKSGKIEEGMNLYSKMLESGYTPDRLTYHLLLRMLCEEERLDLAVQVSKEMRARGFDMDLATSTMLIHLLCKMHRYEEAFREFEDMIRRGVNPQYLTFHRLRDELRKHGMTEMAQKLCNMLSSVPHSTNMPNTYTVYGDSLQLARKKTILHKAEAMSQILKTCKDPRELVKHRSTSENLVSIANRLMEDIKKRAHES